MRIENECLVETKPLTVIGKLKVSGRHGEGEVVTLFAGASAGARWFVDLRGEAGDDSDILILDENRLVIATMPHATDDEGERQQVSSAKLVAAAPKLRDAVLALREAAADYEDDDGLDLAKELADEVIAELATPEATCGKCGGAMRKGDRDEWFCDTCEVEVSVDVQMESPVGPRVIYSKETATAVIEAAIPRGWSVDYTSQVETDSGRFSCPLVRS